jgi:hypothetical protein
MTMMYENNIPETDEGKATLVEIEDAKAAVNNINAEIVAGDAAADGNSADPDLDDLLNGNITTAPSWSERRLSLLRSKQKVNGHLDKLFLRLNAERTKARMKHAVKIKPEVDGLEKEIIDAAIVLHKLHLDYFQAKRSFINNSIGTYGNFSCTIDDILGAPVDSNTKWAWMFREAVKKGLIKQMPAGLK